MSWNAGSQNWQKQGWHANRPASAPQASWQPSKPAAGSVTPKPTSTASAGPEAYLCQCKGKDAKEEVVKTLVGEYQEHGSNHGRKVYKKVVENVPGAVDAYLYYWDKRDGPSFQGWWFGNQVGGQQVWSLNSAETQTPPIAGWKIPWDGPVRPSVTVTRKVAQGQKPARDPESQDTSAVTAPIDDAIQTAKQAVEEAKTLMGDLSDPEELKQAEQLLAPQVAALNATMKSSVEKQRGTTPDVAKRMNMAIAQLRTAQQSVNSELAKVRAAKTKVDVTSKQRDAEVKEMTVFNSEILPEAQSKTDLAEDSVEKAVITSEMIAAAGDDMTEVKQAVMQTEQAVSEAQKALGEARIFINAKQAALRRFESEAARSHATSELARLSTQLQDAHKKLEPLKGVRNEYMQRSAAQRLVAELLDKLTPSEVDVDRAEEAAMMLSADDDPSPERMKTAESALAKANATMTVALKFIDSKKKGASGTVLAEVAKLEERANASLERLGELKNALKEATEKTVCNGIVNEAVEKIQAVSEAIDRATDAEGPFLMGVEELPLAETLSAVKACESAATSANTLVSIARMYFATKLVEAKRFSKGASEGAVAKLKECQEQLESHTLRLNELKTSTAARKKKAVMQESESEVAKAEELTKTMAEAANPLEDNAKFFELSAAEIKAAAVATQKAEVLASAALTEARKFITARQIEAKGKDVSSAVSSELIKFQTRLSHAQSEVTKYKKIAAGVDTRIAAKKAVESVTTKLEAAEAKASVVTKAAEELGAASAPTEKDLKANETAAAEAAATLRSVAKHMELSTRSGPAKDEIEKLRPRLQASQDALDKAVTSMKEIAEKAQVLTIKEEAEQRVKAAEDTVSKVVEAEAPLGKDDLPADDLGKALTTLEASISSANSAIGGAKTFLAMKRLAAKRLAEAAKQSTTEVLTKLQDRLDTAAKTLTETKRGMVEKKAGAVRKEVAALIAGVEEKVDAAEKATTVLMDDSQMTAETMKSACEKGGQSQAEAQSAIEKARDLLLSRQRDMKTASAETNTAILAEISKSLEQVTKLQGALDKSKVSLRDQEHKFVAQQLLTVAKDTIEKVEKKLEDTRETAAILTSDKPDSFTAMIFLTHIIDDLLRPHKKNAKMTVQELFHAMSEKTEQLSEAQFIAFVTKLLELEEHKDAFFTEEQQKAAFKKMLAEGTEVLTEQSFAEQFRMRYAVTTQVSMTDSFVLKGGKTLRKLEAGEIVEALEEPGKEETVGIMRVKAKSDKDGREGFISISGNQGTIYLEPYSALVECRKKVDRALQDMAEAVKDALKFIDAKAEELKAVRSGPLAETKSELLKLRPRVAKVQYAQGDLKKKVTTAQKTLGETMEREKKKRQDAAEKKAATALLEEANAKVNAVQAEVDKVLPPAEALAKSAGADEEDALKAMDKASEELEATAASAEKATSFLKEKLESIRGSVKGPLGEVRAALVKLKVTVGTFDSKCKKQVVALRNARKQVANDAHNVVVGALHAHAQKGDLSAEELFKQLSKGDDIPCDSMREYLLKLPDVSFKTGQLELGLERYAAGFSKLSFLALVQEYQKCVKEIAITTAFEVNGSKTIRKLAVGETVEVLEPAKVDQAVGLARVKCRALTDATVGWVTLKGNHGTPFLENGSKPYFCCEQEAPLGSAFEATSSEVRRLKVGEVFEVLEGPRKEPPKEIVRLRGKARKDGKAGWATLKDATGTELLALTKMFVCKLGIAITNTFDIAEGKAIRKLDVGETLEPLDSEEKKDEKTGVVRTRVRATRDQQEGWVTLTGSKGTAYVEPNDKLYVCRHTMPLEARATPGSTAHRMLEVDEVFEASDAPKSEIKEGANRAKGRNLSDGTEGWFTVAPKAMSPWSPQYTCSASTVLHDGLDVSSAKALRKLEPGERLQALATPALDAASSLLRIHVRAEKDGKTGFATLRGNQGTVLLEPVGPGSGVAPPGSKPSAPPSKPPASASAAKGKK